MKKILIAALVVAMIFGLAAGALAWTTSDSAEFFFDLRYTNAHFSYHANSDHVSGWTTTQIDQGYAIFNDMGYLKARSVNPYHVTANTSVYIYQGTAQHDTGGSHFNARLKIRTRFKEGTADLKVTENNINSSAYKVWYGSAKFWGIDGFNPKVMENGKGTGGNGKPDEARIDHAVDLDSSINPGYELDDVHYKVVETYTMTY